MRWFWIIGAVVLAAGALVYSQRYKWGLIGKNPSLGPPDKLIKRVFVPVKVSAVRQTTLRGCKPKDGSGYVTFDEPCKVGDIEVWSNKI